MQELLPPLLPLLPPPLLLLLLFNAHRAGERKQRCNRQETWLIIEKQP
jgi:hypothetical protein